MSLPIVLLGAGGIAHDAHLPAYRKAGYSVASVADADPQRAQKLAQQFDIPVACKDVQEAVATAPEKCVFDLAVPAPHVLSVLKQLPQGAFVLIQKPMGETIEEARAILNLCQERHLQAAVNFQLRWSPNMVAARTIADSGELGQIHDAEVKIRVYMPWQLWSFLAKAPRLEILYHSIHYVDLMRSWFGNPRTVLAKTTRNPVTPQLAPTKSVIILDYGDERRVFLSANHAHEFQGSQESYVQWEGTAGAMRAVMGVNLDYPRGMPDTLEVAKRHEGWTNRPVTGSWFPDAFAGSMGSLLNFATGKTSVLPTRVEDAFDTMRVVEAAYMSSERGGVVVPL